MAPSQPVEPPLWEQGPAPGERLQKVLAQRGYGSRRVCEELITAGRVRINGRVATLGDRVEVESDVVEVDGRPAPLRPDLVYYLLNKPVGVVSQPTPGVLRITIHEGRNRQVRRMCSAVGHSVVRLVRIRIGPLADRRLAPGSWRTLAADEVRSLIEALPSDVTSPDVPKRGAVNDRISRPLRRPRAAR